MIRPIIIFFVVVFISGCQTAGVKIAIDTAVSADGRTKVTAVNTVTKGEGKSQTITMIDDLTTPGIDIKYASEQKSNTQVVIDNLTGAVIPAVAGAISVVRAAKEGGCHDRCGTLVVASSGSASQSNANSEVDIRTSQRNLIKNKK